MFFWFAGLSFVLVAAVFASPAIDYRLVMGASVLPVLEMIAGGPWALHTLLAPVTVMTLVMLVFHGQRLVQRRWLGIAIGLFMYLVLDGAWTRTTLFWWPFFGFTIDPSDTPTWEAPLVIIAMEVVGLAALAWGAHRYQVDKPAGRQHFLATGQLTRAAMGPPSGTC